MDLGFRNFSLLINFSKKMHSQEIEPNQAHFEPNFIFLIKIRTPILWF